VRLALPREPGGLPVAACDRVAACVAVAHRHAHVAGVHPDQLAGSGIVIGRNRQRHVAA
jgi:hypothetical protein